MDDILINDRFRLGRKIGSGGFGVVFTATDTHTNQEVALKLGYMHDRPDMPPTDFSHEAQVYAALAGGPAGVGVPRLHWHGRSCEYDVLATDLLGPSLEDLFTYCGRRLSLKTVLMIADQAISRLQGIHAKGYLHRDIKPDNFLMGVGKSGNTLHVIDFGLARKWERAAALHGMGLPPVPFRGTAEFASLNSHLGREQSWGDDLESLGYVLISLLRGSLPWDRNVYEHEGELELRTKEMKQGLDVVAFCDGLPGEFATYLNYTRGLGFREKPRYGFLRGLFRRAFRREGFAYDHVFDWTERLYHESAEDGF